MADKDVVFRRINGRIVPIRKKKGQKVSNNPKSSKIPNAKRPKVSAHEKAKSAGFIAAGFGSSLLGGLSSGGFFKRGVKEQQMSFNFGKGKSGFSEMEGLFPGAKLFKKAKRTKRFSRKGAFVAQLVGGALIGEGITKLAPEFGFDQSDTTNIVSGASGEIAAFTVGAGFEKAARGTSLKKTFRSGFSKAAKIVIRKKFKL